MKRTPIGGKLYTTYNPSMSSISKDPVTLFEDFKAQYNNNPPPPSMTATEASYTPSSEVWDVVSTTPYPMVHVGDGSDHYRMPKTWVRDPKFSGEAKWEKDDHNRPKYYVGYYIYDRELHKSFIGYNNDKGFNMVEIIEGSQKPLF